MENDYRPTDALADAAAAREDVSRRAKAPAYYYPVLGVLLGALMAAICVIEGVWFTVISLLIIGALLLLERSYRHTTGLAVTYGHSTGRSRVLWTTYAAALVVLAIAALALREVDGWWPALLIGVVTFAVSWGLGLLVERAIVRDLAQERA